MIPGNLDLSHKEISVLDLSFTTIKGDLNLEYCHLGSLNLSRILVNGELKLSHGNIHDHSALDGMVVHGKAQFSHSRMGSSDFSLVHFHKAVDFSGMIFNDRSLFAIAIFENFVDFSYVYFMGEVHFQGTMFLAKASFYHSRLGRATFTNTEIADISFAGADIREVVFSGAVFPKDYRLIEERNAEYPEDYARAEGVYRAIKQNLQSSGDYEGAGRFFIREMECHRRQLRQNRQWLRWLWYTTMKGLCNYGESPPRVFVAVLGTIIVFSIIYGLFGVRSEDGTFSYGDMPQKGILSMIWRSLYLSVITFTTVGYGDPRPADISQVAAAVESFLGIFLTAVFVVTFTRRLSR